MSVIAQNVDSNTLELLTKGADNIMEPRINWKSEIDRQTVIKHLNDFAVEGLRTLVMGRKILTQQEFDTNFKAIVEMEQSNDPAKEDKLFEIYNKLETGLEFLGASAIEDKLQVGVPETIEKLIEANIRVWILTGDKQETAIEIGKSSRLIQPNMSLLILSSDTKD
jgi:magnesium-transporting ATPase (P-type)